MEDKEFQYIMAILHNEKDPSEQRRKIAEWVLDRPISLEEWAMMTQPEAEEDAEDEDEPAEEMWRKLAEKVVEHKITPEEWKEAGKRVDKEMGLEDADTELIPFRDDFEIDEEEERRLLNAGIEDEDVEEGIVYPGNPGSTDTV